MANQHDPYQQQFHDPFQQGQQFHDPYGQSQHEGMVEEHIHRTATKRINHSRTPLRDVFERPGLTGRVAVLVGLAGILVAAAALTLLMLYKGSAQAQMSQVQHQLATMSQQLQAAQEANATSYNGLSGKVSALGTAVGNLNAAVSPWSLTCAQALESQDGPGTYYFPCSDTKP
jgi:hypothetical protein